MNFIELNFLTKKDVKIVAFLLAMKEKQHKIMIEVGSETHVMTITNFRTCQRKKKFKKKIYIDKLISKISSVKK